MTTPQNQLYNLAYQVKRLAEMFDVDDEELDIFEAVKQLYIGHQVLLKHMERLEDQMTLIIKLLGKLDG